MDSRAGPDLLVNGLQLEDREEAVVQAPPVRQRGRDDCAIIWFLHRYEFNCESQHERTLLALGLRAATARLAKHPSMVGKGGLLRLAVPAKPLGFLNAALTERNVAFPEPFRSRILPESKELVESEPSEGRRMSAGLHK